MSQAETNALRKQGGKLECMIESPDGNYSLISDTKETGITIPPNI